MSAFAPFVCAAFLFAACDAKSNDVMDAGPPSSSLARLFPNGDSALANFGSAVALSGTMLAVGASGETQRGDESSPDLVDAGAVHIYERQGSGWALATTVVPESLEAGDHFGSAVALDGTTLVVGAPGRDVNPDTGTGLRDVGAVFVFEGSGAAWTESAALPAPADRQDGDGLGSSLSLSGDTLVVGASGDDAGGLDTGSLYAYQRVGDQWQPL